MAKAGDKVLVSSVSVDSSVQLFDCSTGDALGQGGNSLGCESVSKVGEEVEGTFLFHNGDFGKLNDIGQHLKVNYGSNNFPGLKCVIRRGGGSDGGVVGDKDSLRGCV